MKRILCLSGGLDSSMAAVLTRGSDQIYPVFFDYGQPCAPEELAAATAVVRACRLNPLEVIELRGIRGVPPTDVNDPASWVVPSRNLLFAANAQWYATMIEADVITFGFVADTNVAIFTDASYEFVEHLNRFGVAHGAGRWTPIDAPVIKWHKRELVLEGIRRRFPLNLTYSCYRGGPRCRECPSCVMVMRAFDDVAVANLDIASDVQRLNPYAVAASPEAACI